MFPPGAVVDAQPNSTMAALATTAAAATAPTAPTPRAATAGVTVEEVGAELSHAPRGKVRIFSLGSLDSLRQSSLRRALRRPRNWRNLVFVLTGWGLNYAAFFAMQARLSYCNHN